MAPPRRGRTGLEKSAERQRLRRADVCGRGGLFHVHQCEQALTAAGFRSRRGKRGDEKMTNRPWQTIALLFGVLGISPAAADWTDARCDIYPKGSDHTDKMIPCVFSQRQGFVTIRRDDGVIHDLEPIGDVPGNFRDQDGRPVYRQSGLGSADLIFRFEDESVSAQRSMSRRQGGRVSGRCRRAARQAQRAKRAISCVRRRVPTRRMLWPSRQRCPTWSSTSRRR